MKKGKKENWEDDIRNWKTYGRTQEENIEGTRYVPDEIVSQKGIWKRESYEKYVSDIEGS